MDDHGAAKSTYSAGAFPANLIPPPENAWEKTTTATCGRKCVESFQMLPQPTSWAKMFADSLVGMGDWYSKRCALTWNLKGTKFGRAYFLLLASTRRTEENGYSLLLKTPCAADAYTEGLTKKEQTFGNSGTLAQEVQTGFIYQRGMLPTPTAQDGKNTTFPPSQANRSSLVGVTMSLLPTPRSTDYNTPRSPEALERAKAKHGSSLEDSLRQRAGQGFQLNPPFVAEMMGFPPNWTELPFQNGETNQ